VAGALPVPFAFILEVPMTFALRMMMLATLLAMYRVSPMIGIAALSIGTGFIVGQRLRRAPATR
jgi:hypothetical protein